MFKKILSLLLAICLLPFLPKAHAAEANSLEDIIAAQYDAYAASIRQDKMDENAIDQLLEPALYGNGSTLHFDESDALTAALYGSALFRKWFIEAASYAVQNMAELHYDQAMIGGSISWHDFAFQYGIFEYMYDTTANPKDDLSYRTYVKYDAQSITANKCDKAMIWVVGTSHARIRLNRTAVDFDSVTYKLDIIWGDDFAFNGNYDKADEKGYNTTFSKLITLLGPLLGLKTFTWDTASSFSITVPNLCTHSGGGSYYWENIDNELVSLPGEGQTDNPLTKHIRESTSDTSPRHYYTPETPIELLSSNPWVMEFYISTGSSFYAGPALKYTDTWLPQIYKSGTAVRGLVTERYRGISPTSGKETTLTKRHYFGLDYVEQGIEKKGNKVFRIENRIAADGSNMLWLLIDGQEMGPLNRHEIYNDSTKETQEAGIDNSWLNGKNITLRYLYSHSFPFTTKPLYWLRIDTAGEVLTTREVAPTCTQSGGTEILCLLCGATLQEPAGESLGHSPQTVSGFTATCHSEGLSDGSVCAVCGEILEPQAVLPVLPHTEVTVSGHAATCTQAGLTDGTVCSVCSEILVPQAPISPLGHTTQVLPGTNADCLSGGITEGALCSVCGVVLQKQEAIPALGHAFENGSCTRCATVDPDWWIPGDADGNKIVNYNDALLVLRCSIGLESLPPFAAIACDVDESGNLSYNDALIILRRSIGLE